MKLLVWLRSLRTTGLCLLIGIPAHAQGITSAEVESWLRQTTTARSAQYPGMGLRPTEQSEYSRIAHVKVRELTRSSRPSRLILDRYLPPVASQGKQGSCGAWSLGYYAYTYAVAKQRKLTHEQINTPKFEFSPAFIYNQINGGKDGGISLGQGCKLLSQLGCSTLLEMPYDPANVTSQPDEAAKARAAKYRSPAYGYLFNRLGSANSDAMKTYLAEMQQPFVIGIPIFKDFPTGPVNADFVYDLTLEPTRANFAGGHALTVIGYDDDKRAFRIVNSWGPQWGDEGFLWISEDFLVKYALCGWGFVAGGPIARDSIATPHVSLESPSNQKK